MKDLAQCAVTFYGLQQWLEAGTTPLMFHYDERDAVMFTRLERAPNVSYLYSVPLDQNDHVSWRDGLAFCGVYDAQHSALYLTESALYSITKGQARFVEESIPSMAEEISDRINRRVEEIIANDRTNLSVRTITGASELRNLQYYQEHGARESMIQQFFNDDVPDIQFHSDYKLKELPEAAFTAYIQDPENFVQSEAKQYIKANEEKFLLQFLENDALQSEYEALMQDTDSPIHRMKAITDAINSCGGKTVNVTIQKGGKELTFKMEAHQMKGYRTYYSSFGIPAADRRIFEQMFGRYADFCAEDVAMITYGRNTIYTAPTMQTEDMAKGMVMGGMA